jgi:transcriptional regulator with XRE-family HTH domain
MSAEPSAGLPAVGETIRRLRVHHGRSLREVAAATGLSTSFLSSVERGDSDIAVGRLALIAEFFDHDVGSLLGYSSRRARPHYVDPEDHFPINRGDGIDYRVVRLNMIGLELFAISFAPHCGFDEAIAHEGVDAAYTVTGQVILTLDDEDFAIDEGACVVFSAAYRHRLRNDQDEPALLVAIGDVGVY